MKKIAFLFIVLVSCSTLWAQEKASSVTLSYCFTTESDTYLTVGCNLPYIWNGISCSETNTYTYNTTNFRGCDSIARLHLTVTNWEDHVTKPSVTMCPADFPYIWESTKADKNGAYNYACNSLGEHERVFTNLHGCDSVVTFTINAASDCRPVGSAKGLFSVSADKQVYFAMGNLQYRATANGTWGDLKHDVSSDKGQTITQANGEFRFAEEQYQVYGEGGGNLTLSDANRNVDTKWIDYFGYGTSGYSSSAPPYTESSSQVYQTSSIDGTNYDWGVYNAISNGGNTPNQWRTLTKAEWSYLLKTRKFNGKGNDEVWERGWARATVEGVKGLLILPDTWTHTYPNNRGQNSTWDNNTYSSTTSPSWKDLENAGAVFLPAAGKHESQRIYNFATYGDYVSSTDSQGNLYWFRFSLISNPDPDHSEQGYNENAGYSVRLVQDYVPQQ